MHGGIGMGQRNTARDAYYYAPASRNWTPRKGLHATTGKATATGAQITFYRSQRCAPVEAVCEKYHGGPLSPNSGGSWPGDQRRG